MNENTPIIVFDESAKKKLLVSLGFSVNQNKEIVDKDNKILTNTDYEPINLDEFGGILRGSKIPIKKEKSELVRYFIRV